MKDYHEYPKQFIGSSDIASLLIRTPLECRVLDFGGDGEYSAYVVDKDAEIGSHYQKIMTAKGWAWIYSDLARVCKFEGDEINIYRSGGYGCVVQILNFDDVPCIKDINGVVIKENCVVRISNAWPGTGSDGLWLVESVYRNRLGRIEAYLHKLRKSDMRKSKDKTSNTTIWPLRCYSSSWKKCEEINTYNEERAKIEVVSDNYVEPAPKPVSNKIKILKHGIKKGTDYCPCRYYVNEDKSITIYARNYGDHIPAEIGNVINESDSMTDYFETDHCKLYPEDKYYLDVLSKCL